VSEESSRKKQTVGLLGRGWLYIYSNLITIQKNLGSEKKQSRRW
jgi:hypothetical protein